MQKNCNFGKKYLMKLNEAPTCILSTKSFSCLNFFAIFFRQNFKVNILNSMLTCKHQTYYIAKNLLNFRHIMKLKNPIMSYWSALNDDYNKHFWKYCYNILPLSCQVTCVEILFQPKKRNTKKEERK